MTEEQAPKITREQLYNEIWEISAAGVAKKYNSDYNDLLKLCKEADIPVPPSGYWVKLKFGSQLSSFCCQSLLLLKSYFPEMTCQSATGRPMPKKALKKILSWDKMR